MVRGNLVEALGQVEYDGRGSQRALALGRALVRYMDDGHIEIDNNAAWSTISGCGSRNALTLRPTLSFFPTPMVGSWIGQLPEPNPESAGGETWITETELPGLAQNDGNAGAAQGVGERHPSSPATLQGRHHGQRVHAAVAGECGAWLSRCTRS